MAIESVSGRDPNDVNASELDENQSVSSGAPPNSSTNASSASSASSAPAESSSPAVQQLANKFAPTWQNVIAARPLNLDGCGTNQDCADLDGRPLREGQRMSEPKANVTFTVRRFAPFESFGGKFEGDAKSRHIPAASEGEGGFTTAPNATSRTILTARVENGQILKPQGSADITRHPLLGEDRATVYAFANSASTTPSEGIINAKSVGSMPLTKAGGHLLSPIPAAPQTDTDLQMAYGMSPGKLKLDGSVWGDKFPNGELIASDANGSRLMLGEFQTKYGALDGPLRLIGDAPRVPQHLMLNLQAEIPLDPNGNFAGSPVIRQK